MESVYDIFIFHIDFTCRLTQAASGDIAEKLIKLASLTTRRIVSAKAQMISKSTHSILSISPTLCSINKIALFHLFDSSLSLSHSLNANHSECWLYSRINKSRVNSEQVQDSRSHGFGNWRLTWKWAELIQLKTHSNFGNGMLLFSFHSISIDSSRTLISLNDFTFQKMLRKWINVSCVRPWHRDNGDKRV